METGQSAYEAFCRGLGVSSGWADLPDRAKNAWFTVECAIGRVSLVYEHVPKAVVEHVRLAAEEPETLRKLTISAVRPDIDGAWLYSQAAPAYDGKAHPHPDEPRAGYDMSKHVTFVRDPAVVEAGIRDLMAEQGKAMGYDGNPCDRCAAFTLKRTGKCTTCDTCGATGGCG